MATWPIDPPDVRLVLERHRETESLAEVAYLTELLDGLVVPCAWLSLFSSDLCQRSREFSRCDRENSPAITRAMARRLAMNETRS